MNALTLLEPHVQPEWLVQQFRHHALKARRDQIIEREGQQQVLRPSFEGIRIPSVIYSVNGWTRSRGVRYSHLVPEHKAQAVAKLEERYKTVREESAVVSPELKEAIGAVSTPKLAQNRNVFLVRRGRGLGIVNEINQNLEAASGFEPLHRGFADLSLNHLGTPP